MASLSSLSALTSAYGTPDSEDDSSSSSSSSNNDSQSLSRSPAPNGQPDSLSGRKRGSQEEGEGHDEGTPAGEKQEAPAAPSPPVKRSRLEQVVAVVRQEQHRRRQALHQRLRRLAGPGSVAASQVTPPTVPDEESKPTLSTSLVGYAMDDVAAEDGSEEGSSPRPLRLPSAALQRRVTRVLSNGRTINGKLKGMKSFRNPNLLGKLVDFCHIDELGSNYPPALFNPHAFVESDFYRARATAQRRYMAELERHRAMSHSRSIAFAPGHHGSPTTTAPAAAGISVPAKAKSRWDKGPA